MLNFLKKLIPDNHPLRLLYHKLKAMIAALVYGFPASKMIVIGVTGTNGKTTTVNLITNILMKAGKTVGMASTINFQIGEKRWVNDTKQSTVSPFKLQKLLKDMVKAGCKYAVIEVTSHAITQSRVFGINFDVGVFTNISADHIEYHGTFDEYLAAKGGLFKKVSKGKRKFGVPKIMILNGDDEYYKYFDQFVADRKITFGLKAATVYAEKIEKNPEGSSFILHVPNNAVPVEIGLPGEYNVYNSLAAAATAMALEVPLDVIQAALKSVTVIPGRFEHVNMGQPYAVIVDYAHTPDALDALLSMYRNLTKNKLYVIFGCTGGGRDKSKRPKMGEIANQYADVVIVTDDDPYSEDEWGIIDQVCQGIPREEGKGLWKIPDRREAIRLALTVGTEGDCVVIAGKGAEEVMMVRGQKIAWNDKKLVEELLSREVQVEIGENEWVKRPNVLMEI